MLDVFSRALYLILYQKCQFYLTFFSRILIILKLYFFSTRFNTLLQDTPPDTSLFRIQRNPLPNRTCAEGKQELDTGACHSRAPKTTNSKLCDNIQQTKELRIVLGKISQEKEQRNSRSSNYSNRQATNHGSMEIKHEVLSNSQNTGSCKGNSCNSRAQSIPVPSIIEF